MFARVLHVYVSHVLHVDKVNLGNGTACSLVVQDGIFVSCPAFACFTCAFGQFHASSQPGMQTHKHKHVITLYGLCMCFCIDACIMAAGPYSLGAFSWAPLGKFAVVGHRKLR